MKKRSLALTGCVLAAGLVLGSAMAASASVTYGSKDCTWPTHAFVEATTKGIPTLKIKAGNGTVSSKTFPSSADWKRNFLNSDDEDAQWGSAAGYLTLQGGGMGCSV